jgi:hypothetical protein
LPAFQKFYDDRLATLPGVQRLSSTLVMKASSKTDPYHCEGRRANRSPVGSYVQLGHASDGRRHPRSQRNIEAWLDPGRAKGFWLVDDDVFGRDEHVCALSVMGARREGIDA